MQMQSSALKEANRFAAEKTQNDEGSSSSATTRRRKIPRCRFARRVTAPGAFTVEKSSGRLSTDPTFYLDDDDDGRRKNLASASARLSTSKLRIDVREFLRDGALILSPVAARYIASAPGNFRETAAHLSRPRAMKV